MSTHLSFVISPRSLQRRPWKRHSADLGQGVGVDQAHMRRLGRRQNSSSLSTALPHPLSPQLPSIPVVSHIENCRLQSIGSVVLAKFAGGKISF